MSKWKLGLLASVSLGFLVFCAILIPGYLENLGTTRIIIVMFMLFIIILFGSSLIYCLKRLISKKPGLIINQEGLYDDVSFLSGVFVKWSEIEHIELIKERNTKIIKINLVDKNRMFNQSKGLKRFFYFINSRYLNTELSLSSNLLPIQIELVYQLLYEYYMNNRMFSIPDIPNWHFEIQEKTNGIYECCARDEEGHEFSIIGVLESQIQTALNELEDKISQYNEKKY